MEKHKDSIIDEYIKKARCFSPAGSHVWSDGEHILIVEYGDSEGRSVSMDEIDSIYETAGKELGVKLDMQRIDKMYECLPDVMRRRRKDARRELLMKTSIVIDVGICIIACCAVASLIICWRQ